MCGFDSKSTVSVFYLITKNPTVLSMVLGQQWRFIGYRNNINQVLTTETTLLTTLNPKRLGRCVKHEKNRMYYPVTLLGLILN